MGIKEVAEFLLELPDEQSGRDNVLNSFKFQVLSAIDLVFKQFKL